jgi:hypothetical protein
VDFFDVAELRLKQQLGVKTAKDVANALGLGEKAFSARKRRGAFPFTEVYALAAKHPELDLDVDYILTGHQRSEFKSVVAATTLAHMKEGREGKEAALLRNYRALPEPLQDAVSGIAETIANLYVAGKGANP